VKFENLGAAYSSGSEIFKFFHPAVVPRCLPSKPLFPAHPDALLAAVVGFFTRFAPLVARAGNGRTKLKIERKKETTMKNKGKSFVLGICRVILGLPPNAAFARSSTAFSSFHVQTVSASQNPYQCLIEDNGAVANNCTYEVTLAFDLPIDSTGTMTITVQNHWYQAAGTSFSCTAYGYTGSTGSALTQSAPFIFNGPTQSVTNTISVPQAGMSIQLICWNVPVDDGLANINWTP
jgi:hypothetical protein